MYNIQKIYDYIERNRKSKKIFWKLAVSLKDFFWFYSLVFKNFIKRLYDKPNFCECVKDVKKYYKISFCTTSMNRLMHVKKTLLKNIKDNKDYPNIEFVIFDYNSTDGLKEWVESSCKEYLNSGILKYYRTDEPKYFHMAHAKNMSHKLATGDVLCNVDADNFTNKNFAFYINCVFNQDKDSVGTNEWEIYKKNNLGDFGGRIFISKENFKKLNGYDEKFIGWGHEDLDFKDRAIKFGLKKITIPIYFLKCIQHNDILREENMPIKKNESDIINKKLFLKKQINK